MDFETHMRCFVAAFVEPESAAEIARQISLPPGLRHLEPSGWHVTLRFIGEIPLTRTDELLGAIRMLGAGTLEVEGIALVGLPRGTAARVVALELARTDQLVEWAALLEQGMGSAGRSQRLLRPHISLARSQPPIRFERQLLDASIAVRLHAPALYRSVLTGSGVRYHRVSTRPR